jgi:hypothetical protein
MQNKAKSLNDILAINEEWVMTFKTSDLMKLINSDAMKLTENRIRLLDCIQTFSNYFQKTMLLRLALTDNANFSALSQEHLDEEYGHNVALLEERGKRPAKWDPILEATSSWFCWKMLTLDNVEKTLLVHLVLEASANIFFTCANEIMQRYKTTDYFNVHAENDERHENIGTKLLENLTPKIYSDLAIVQEQGWEMLISACNRMASLAT